MGLKRTQDCELADDVLSFWHHADGDIEIEIDRCREHAVAFVDKEDVPTLIEWLKERVEAPK